MLDIELIIFYLLALVFAGLILFFVLGSAVLEAAAFIYYLFFRKEEKNPEKKAEYSIEQGEEVK